MAPRLVVQAGLFAGQVYVLAEGDLTIGRDAGNTVCLPDPAVSRHHCVITTHANGWRIRDLESSNGTFVNGIQVSAHDLTEGDRIAVGGSVLLFATAGTRAPEAVELLEPDVQAATLRLPIEDIIYLTKADPSPHASRVEQGLRTLLSMSTVINAVGSEEELYRELLRLVCDAVPAEQAAIILQRAGGDLQVVQTAGSEGTPLEFGRHVVLRVLTERAGVLSRDVAMSRSFAAEKPLAGNVHSLLCVPIIGRDAPSGVLYMVTRQRAAFDEEHLQLAAAMARIAATTLHNVRQLAGLEREAQRFHADLQLRHQLVGKHPLMDAVYERMRRVAPADTTVLIQGETGTGKELVAHAIHLGSPRARRPFVAINCAAITETLLESELFGHERGAFTGAVGQRKGRLEAADGGTVFLDEIGELALSMQSKLLRVLQQRTFERVGGTQPVAVNIRVISATNRNLSEEIRAGRFRSDLYYRLNVVSIDLPSLRDRRSDIPALAEHFLSKYAPKAGRRVEGLSPAALECLLAYDWPGNVRELENAIERAAVLGSTENILPEDLPEAAVEAAIAPSPARAAGSFQAAVLETKKQAVIAAFRASGGSYVETARALKVHPNYLHRLVKSLGLKAALEGGA